MKFTADDLTDTMVISAMCPAGGTMKYGAIVEQLAQSTGLRGYDVYRKVDGMLQRMKREGRVELVKGKGGGWRKKESP
jgi:DNA-binding IscR family transcriptional regulator